MELWALMKFQDYKLNDDGVSFYFIFYALWLQLQGCKQALKFNERFSHKEGMYLIVISHAEITLAFFF